MSEYMSIFQIGPVQEFIQTARKTQDYWAGSFLLSFLNARAISKFGDENVIFPHINDCKLYKAAITNGIPWERPMGDDYYKSSLPNRFFAMTTGNPKDLLRDTKQAVIDDFKKIASTVYDYIQKKADNILSQEQTTIWNDQIDNRSFEIIYVWREKPDNQGYADAYTEAETLLGSRKSTRVFEYPLEQGGYACSLCGLRTALGSGQCKTREDMRNWWKNNMRKKKPLLYKFRDGEYLCAVCTVKRLAPEIVFKSDLDIPSTSAMSASSFVRDIISLKDGASFQEIAAKFETFQDAAKKAAEKIDEPPEINWPDFLRLRHSKIRPKVDGDWYYDSFYEHTKRKDFTIDAQKAWKSFWGKCKEAKPDILPPSRYFAMLAADGDSMGGLLQNIKSKELHEFLSNLLVQFSVQVVPDIIEKHYPGYVLYWGGDEGVAMVCLEDLFNIMTNLHEAWYKSVEFPLQQKGVNNATLSVGAVIIHHQYPLRSAIAEVQQTLETAKAVVSHGRKKDAWAVRILRRSGAPVTARAHWSYDTFKPLLHLEDFQQAYRKSWLSPKWIADLRAEQLALNDPKPETTPDSEEVNAHWENSRYLYEHESKRLIKRHISPDEDTIKDQHMEKLITNHRIFNNEISCIFQPNYLRHQDITAMMDLAQYVAKGGGR